jgi:hypothetical protein
MTAEVDAALAAIESERRRLDALDGQAEDLSRYLLTSELERARLRAGFLADELKALPPWEAAAHLRAVLADTQTTRAEAFAAVHVGDDLARRAERTGSDSGEIRAAVSELKARFFPELADERALRKARRDELKGRMRELLAQKAGQEAEASAEDGTEARLAEALRRRF